MRAKNWGLFLVISMFPAACGSSGGSGGPDGGPSADPGALCGAAICEAEEMCVDDQCVAECPDVADLCGASSEHCCNDAQACLSDACVDLGRECEFTEDCDVDEICEPTLGHCVPRDAVAACEYVPPPGVFSPQVGCQWQPPAGAFSAYAEVVMTPSVANLTDDNGDGKTNRNDIPDVVFISFDRAADGCCTSKGVIRIASGQCNLDGSMATIATVGGGAPYVGNSSGIALANLHPDSMTTETTPEIVATIQNGGTIAYRRTADDGSAWEELWSNLSMPTVNHTHGGAQPAVADLNGDGQPEVIIGNVVLNGLDGTLVWDGSTSVGASAGIGNNAFLGPASTVADIDLDGQLEVIAGNTAYRADGTELWTYEYTTSNSTCQGGLPCDGLNGVGNFDQDDQGEVVIVRLGEVFVLNHDGSELHRVAIPVDNCSRNESGPPTIADFDGDGRAEIGTASADFYVVVDFDCTGDPLPAGCDSENILWKVPNQDCSSRVTGSSVFDFDGDGNAEVVYADETSFRIFSGKDGTVLFDDPSHSSNTRMEMPIVVDVDNDGKSEIIVPEPNHGAAGLGGIEIWEDTDNNWVRTRRIWNQHAYHVTNIDEDGQVPRVAEVNWLNPRLNNFRQNVQPDGLFDAADLIAEVELTDCIVGANAAVTITNEGALGVAAGVNVFVEVKDNGGAIIESGVITTTIPLLPGQSEILSFPIADPVEEMIISVTADSDELGASQYNECNEDNNAGDTMVSCGGIE